MATAQEERDLMIEIPEAAVLANQINEMFYGAKITGVVAGKTPNKFAWFSGDPADYPAMLLGKTIGEARPAGGRVEVSVKDYLLHFGEGALLRYLSADERVPEKHQLLLTFENGSSLVCGIAMYACFYCFNPNSGERDIYTLAAQNATSPLAAGFDYTFFTNLIDEKTAKLSAKAFLATEQRIPGLGNGVLQDILFYSHINPRRKVNTLSPDELTALYDSVKTTLLAMATQGGRDTEKNLFGTPGGYVTQMSRMTLKSGCPACGGKITRETYLGGAVYYCEKCQPK